MLGQGFETSNSVPFAGKTVTLSFYARAGANFSSASNALLVIIQNGTGTDQNVFVGYTGNNNIIGQTKTLTTTWQRFTTTGIVPANATELGFQVSYTPTGTAGTNDYFEITGVQLEAGSTATSFSRAGGDIQGELAKCQRYYWRNTADTIYSVFGTGTAESTTLVIISVPIPVTMRALPTSVDVANISLVYGPTLLSISSLTLNSGESGRNFPTITANTTGATVNGFYRLLANNSTAAYIGFSAEL